MTAALDVAALETQLAAERQKVDVASHDFSVRELARMMVDGELNVAPAYQRKFRWRLEGESTFIESLLLGLPVPPLFVATNRDFEWEVVDGLQRLSTVMHFMAADTEQLKLVNRQDNLQLTGLEKLTQLNGKKYNDLPKSLQLYFGRQPLQVVSLTDKSDLGVRFNLFERLNKGAIALSPQEVRACVYRGEFNDFVEGLAELPELSALLKLQEAKQHDGTSAEQVLKFFAYRDARDKFDGRVEKFLNDFNETEAPKLRLDTEHGNFVTAVQALNAACHGGPFLRADYSVTPLVQFEACLVAVADLQAEGHEVCIPDAGWLDDIELKRASMGGTNTRAMLDRRIDRAKELLRG